MDYLELFKKMDEILAPAPCLKFKIESRNTSLFDSKIGGVPYFPKNMEFPTGKNNGFADKPLALLAQLNFEQLPHIENFPTKGILQFFIAPDNVYGMSWNFKNLTAQDNFRVVYHESIIHDESQLMTADDITVYSEEDGYYMPFTGEYRLIPEEPCTMPVSEYDYRFGSVIVEAYNMIIDEEDEETDDSGWIMDQIPYKYFIDRNCSFEAMVGGYPEFTQFDPRQYDNKYKKYNVVLFELNSNRYPKREIDIMWGDSGTGTFMIPMEKLKALDFSDVIYNFDCC